MKQGISIKSTFKSTLILRPQAKNSASDADILAPVKKQLGNSQTLSLINKTETSVDSRKVLVRPRNPTDSVDSKQSTGLKFGFAKKPIPEEESKSQPALPQASKEQGEEKKGASAFTGNIFRSVHEKVMKILGQSPATRKLTAAVMTQSNTV